MKISVAVLGSKVEVEVADGVVTGTAVGTSGAAASGLQGQTIILSPTASNGAITWAVTGTCKGDSMC